MSYSAFEVIDVEEISSLSSETKSYISRTFLNARNDLEYLEEMADLLGWQKVKGLIVERAVPKRTNIRRGEFGETLRDTKVDCTCSPYRESSRNNR